MTRYMYFVLFHFYSLSVFGYNVDSNFPMIYEDPVKILYGRKSYFGYSVLLNSSWIQIGSPRANFSTKETNIQEPGVAYHCKFNKSWVQLSLGPRVHLPMHKASWFGVAMDFQAGINGNIVVCGHRWMNPSDLKQIPGACYSFQPNQNLEDISNILTPTFSNKKNEKFLKIGGKHVSYRNALSQAGMSVHFSGTNKNEKSSLLLGAPGHLNWKGTVVKCKDLARCTNTNTIANTYSSPDVHQFDLFGYQVSSGNFFSKNELVFVGSAPRDNSMKGYIMIYKFQKKEEKVEKILQIFGETTGEYFGNSIAVADITGDGLDDLIVGAPFFCQNGDEGRVYILEFHKDRSLKYKEHVDGKKENGWFGFAVSSLGDLDHDGFADIAVGAPYEGNGVIYIYYGGSSGLKASPQRITAESIHHSLEGFGNSFSGGVDMDGNKYFDTAVGSFLSGHVVILRTRPVVLVNADISSMTNKISPTDLRAEVLVCVYFNGTYDRQLNVTRRILADGTYRRAKPYSVQDTVLLDAKRPFVCKNYSFSITHSIQNIEQSLEFRLSVYVTNTSNNNLKQPLRVWKNGTVSGFDGFNYQDPIQRMSAGSSEKSLLIPFIKECESEVCIPNLLLNCYLLENGYIFNLSYPFILGSMAKYQLRMDVKNIGETSYATHIQVKFPKEIRLGSMPFICYGIDQTVSCQIGIIRKNGAVSTVLDLDMSSVEQLIAIDQTLHIYVSVNTSGNDLNIDKNFRQLNLILSLDVDAYIYGKSQKDNYAVSKLDNGSFATVLEVVHVYEIHKKGLSPLKMLELSLQVPVNVTSGEEEIQVISLYQPDAIIDSKLWLCNVEFGCKDCLSISSKQMENVESSMLDTIQLKRSDPEDNVLEEKAPPSNRTLYINCSSEYVKCTTVKCQTTDLEAYGKVTLRLEVDIAKLGPLMGQKDIVFVTSAGEAKVIHPDISSAKNIQQEWPHVAVVSSIIIGKIPKKIVALWIIVASAVGGILLAMFMTLGLAKAGFFQRKTREELQELKEEARKSQIGARPMSKIEDDADPIIELR